ncbi:YdeI/OmpD-associated family protein [Halalkalibacter alkaliphilus]|uniref:YdeI/OmpD-associated family protein n=1 Tax=Halalkalibacter alkaliphilus TaxID=2917993 RepID=A0A9X1ZZ05_9BACI|nr:YdeI/OmpD-associated family protein [Halalkalibacter alkaliphilus]MCL7745660.1 YdeI/OmpD-associated family protein [Halalkalibacter alkaliphilus]
MTIINKLNLNKYTNMAVINQPHDYDLFNEFKTTLSNDHDAIFVFVETVNEMIEHTQRIIQDQCLLEKGYVFFAYPKKGNKRYTTYIHRDEIFPAMQVGEDGYVENSDLKFSRMVSMDDIFTVVGLKREKKKEKKSSAASQCVADYEGHVPDVEKLLADYPTELSFFQNLTPGYQRDWARFIFSAKQQKTRDKRREKMVEVLSQEYKSIDLYRQMKK